MNLSYRYVPFIIFLFVLIGCQSESALPTRVPVLSRPEEVAVVEDAVAETAVSINIPGTFTPPPDVTIDPALNFGDNSPLGPSVTPSITPILPTSTPYIAAGPPTRTRIATRTPTPLPTPTGSAPIAPAPNPINSQFPVITGSKLSIHVIRNNDKGIMDFVRFAQPSTLKVVDDLGFTSEVRKASPNTIIVGRVNQFDQNYEGNPEAAARAYVQRHLTRYLLNSEVDFWEGWNEPDPNLENMDWYARFEQERVREMARYGLKTAIGGFATGTPEVNEFALFVPAVETALQYGGILTLHEYGAPEINFLYGGALPGYPPYPDRGALTFRYRWFYRELLEPAGLVIPLVVTEAGLDGIIGNRPGPDGYGWQDFSEYGVARGWGNTGSEAFMAQLAWYDRGVRQDSYVLGFTVFTAGPVGHWHNYDIGPLLPMMTDYVINQR
ncbi:MAG: hypothetical protein AAF490_08375 [Chloroflexota bacterium]